MTSDPIDPNTPASTPGMAPADAGGMPDIRDEFQAQRASWLRHHARQAGPGLADSAEGHAFDAYEPAYRIGAQARQQHGDQPFEAIAPLLEREWQASAVSARIPWDDAVHAAHAAWHGIEEALPGDGGDTAP